MIMNIEIRCLMSHTAPIEMAISCAWEPFPSPVLISSPVV